MADGPNPSVKKDLVVTRVFNAPVELVWRAWTEPAWSMAPQKATTGWPSCWPHPAAKALATSPEIASAFAARSGEIRARISERTHDR